MTTFATIMDKLKKNPEYPIFIRMLNGDQNDSRDANMQYVHIHDALAHINDWKVDWVCALTDEERRVVRFNVEEFSAFLKSSMLKSSVRSGRVQCLGTNMYQMSGPRAWRYGPRPGPTSRPLVAGNKRPKTISKI